MSVFELEGTDRWTDAVIHLSDYWSPKGVSLRNPGMSSCSFKGSSQDRWSFLSNFISSSAQKPHPLDR